MKIAFRHPFTFSKPEIFWPQAELVPQSAADPMRILAEANGVAQRTIADIKNVYAQRVSFIFELPPSKKPSGTANSI
jgi:hypothetical protein